MARVINLGQFNAAVAASVGELVEKASTRLVRKIAIEALTRIVRKTPVDTGRARGNWRVGVNTEPQGETETLDPSGGTTISRGVSALSTLPKFPQIFIVNNVPYIEALENGSSQQAPEGMVAVTFEELRLMFGE